MYMVVCTVYLISGGPMEEAIVPGFRLNTGS